MTRKQIRQIKKAIKILGLRNVWVVHITGSGGQYDSPIEEQATWQDIRSCIATKYWMTNSTYAGYQTMYLEGEIR